MKSWSFLAAAALILGAACSTTAPPATAPAPADTTVATTPAPTPQPAPVVAPAPAPAPFTIPVEYHKLDNGLKVVLSQDRTAPTAVVAVYYNIGFRVEPRDRTGFAHLFEHLMFQGSDNLGKMEFIKLVQSNGGVLNGSTRFDFTNYFEIVPAHTLQTVLWAEADRMRSLAINQENLKNQQEVVKNEVRVNVLNQPYGGFPWLDMPQYANTNWYNAHNFYGDLSDLDAATIEDARSFFKTYYAPNNASIAITGDFEPAQALAWVKQYFGNIPAQPQPPKADISEPRQTAEKRASKDDPKATRPALAVAWHAPAQNTPEYYAMGLIEQILTAGKDSWVHQDVVQRRGLTGEVSSSMNLLGSMFDINGPALYMTWLFHDKDKPADDIVRALDENITRLQTQLVDTETLNRARTKMRSSLYGEIESIYGFGRANLLASFALFDDDPHKINRIESEFAKVTPELIQSTAREYLRPTNRTILTIVPKG